MLVGHADAAVVTVEALAVLFVMNCQVFRQVGLLCEALEATGLTADEGALASVHAQMVEKVMPLSEEHATLLVVALQDFHLSHCPRVLVFEYTEFPSIRHCLLDFDC